ncbi:MAG: integrin alpha [Planctomycetota bacterium]
MTARSLPGVALLVLAPLALAQEPLLEIDGRAGGDAFGQHAASLGDVNGDGVPDLIASGVQDPGAGMQAGTAAAYSGATGSILFRYVGQGAYDRMGWWLDATEDLNGDGRRDWIVSAGFPQSSTGPVGRVEVRSGWNGAIVHSFVPATLGPNFNRIGDRVGGTPDLDGDGLGDFYFHARTSTQYGVRVHSGATGALLHEHMSSHVRFAQECAAVTDVDGDGVFDFVLSDEGSSSSGSCARLVSGRTGAFLLDIACEVSTLEVLQVADAGDVDRDGVGDIAVGIERGGQSFVRVVSGATGADLHVFQNRFPGDDFGRALCNVGDFDGDGFPDLGVGAPRDVGSIVRAGAAYVFSGADGSELFQVTGSALGDRVGSDVASAGDLDGDGRSDVLIGRPKYSFQHGVGSVVAYRFGRDEVELDFELDDDLVTPLENGRAVGGGARFGRLFRVDATGPGHFGPAVFDSSSTGPNSGGVDVDLLVDRGNVLILQARPEQAVPGIFDVPDDTATGGTFVIEPVVPSRLVSLELIDVDAGTLGDAATVVLTDASGATRTYLVPGGFTSDGTTDPANAARRLDLQTLFPQVGFAATATAVEDAGFDADATVRVEVTLTGSGAIDGLRLRSNVDPLPALRTLHVFPPPADPVVASDHGRSTAGAGDLDGDGLGEVYVSTPPNVEVRSGASGAVLRTLSGPVGSQFGEDVVGVEDLDGDGVPDAFIGAWHRDDAAGQAVGAVDAVSGATGALLWRVEGPSVDSWFGRGLTDLGDVDGDSIPDVAVGAPNADQRRGEVRVLSGATGAEIRRYVGTTVGNELGSVLGSGSDVDGDGVLDLMVGEPLFAGTGVESGHARVFSGATGALLLTVLGAQANDTLGATVAGLGDIDGDGQGDLAVGLGRLAPRETRGLSGADGSVLFTVPGIGIATTDLDGDGFRDLVTRRTEPGPLGGTLSITRGFSGRSGTILFQTERPLTEVILGFGDAGDVDGDGFGDFLRTRITPGPPGFQVNVVEVFSLSRVNGAPVCLGAVNSTGFRALLRPDGSFGVADDDLTLRASALPAGALVLVLSSPSYGVFPNPAIAGVASDGDLCVAGGPITRHAFANAVGTTAVFPLDLMALPTVDAPGGVRAAMAGETRYWQCWYRDVGAAGRSNFSDAIRITFE